MKNATLTIFGSLIFVGSTFASTLSERPIENSLIVYNANVGLVHEERKLSLKANDDFILYKGVASTIETDSVNVKLPKSVTIYSQQYRFDKLTRQKLLDAHVSKEALVGNEKVTLLSSDASGCLVRTQDGVVKSVEAKDVEFGSIPDELITQPSLAWNVKASKDEETTMEMDYLIKNISWSSDYTLNVEGDSANLSGWITIQNNSGKAFEDTELYVLAGDINRAKKDAPEVRYMKAMADSTSVVEQAHEGYHFYAAPFKVNLANNEKTQVKFISEDALEIKRKYSVALANPLYLNGEIKTSATQYVKLQNLDVALPKGVVRTYSKLKKTTILLGETNIEHTPKNRPIELKIGTNFDLLVTQTTLLRNDNQSHFDVDVNYEIQNSSDEDKTLELLAPFNKNGDSRVNTNQKYVFTKGNFVTFSVLVKANSSKSFKVNYQSKKQG